MLVANPHVALDLHAPPFTELLTIPNLLHCSCMTSDHLLEGAMHYSLLEFYRWHQGTLHNELLYSRLVFQFDGSVAPQHHMRCVEPTLSTHARERREPLSNVWWQPWQNILKPIFLTKKESLQSRKFKELVRTHKVLETRSLVESSNSSTMHTMQVGLSHVWYAGSRYNWNLFWL